MFKVDRNLLPSHLIKSFYQNSEIHHCTRTSDNYHVESVNTNIKRFSINYKGHIIWNSIPPSIRPLNNINQFKRHVIDTLLEKYQYQILGLFNDYVFSISFLSFFFGGFYGVFMFCTIMCVLFVLIT